MCCAASLSTTFQADLLNPTARERGHTTNGSHTHDQPHPPQVLNAWGGKWGTSSKIGGEACLMRQSRARYKHTSCGWGGGHLINYRGRTSYSLKVWTHTLTRKGE